VAGKACQSQKKRSPILSDGTAYINVWRYETTALGWIPDPFRRRLLKNP